MSVVVAQASRGTCRPSSKRKLNPIKGIACPRLMRLNTLVLGLSFLERVCVITGLKYIENWAISFVRQEVWQPFLVLCPRIMLLKDLYSCPEVATPRRTGDKVVQVRICWAKVHMLHPVQKAWDFQHTAIVLLQPILPSFSSSLDGPFQYPSMMASESAVPLFSWLSDIVAALDDRIMRDNLRTTTVSCSDIHLDLASMAT